MKIFLLLLPYLFTGLAVSIVAVLIERLMILAGWTPGNTVIMIFCVFIATVLFQFIKFPEPISLDESILAGLVIGLMGANRFELARTFKEGRWWWKSTNDTHQ
jgi:hypothetical protein